MFEALESKDTHLPRPGSRITVAGGHHSLTQSIGDDRAFFGALHAFATARQSSLVSVSVTGGEDDMDPSGTQRRSRQNSHDQHDLDAGLEQHGVGHGLGLGHGHHRAQPSISDVHERSDLERNHEDHDEDDAVPTFHDDDDGGGAKPSDDAEAAAAAAAQPASALRTNSIEMTNMEGKAPSRTGTGSAASSPAQPPQQAPPPLHTSSLSIGAIVVPDDIVSAGRSVSSSVSSATDASWDSDLPPSSPSLVSSFSVGAPAGHRAHAHMPPPHSLRARSLPDIEHAQSGGSDSAGTPQEHSAPVHRFQPSRVKRGSIDQQMSRESSPLMQGASGPSSAVASSASAAASAGGVAHGSADRDRPVPTLRAHPVHDALSAKESREERHARQRRERRERDSKQKKEQNREWHESHDRHLHERVANLDEMWA